MVAAFLVASPVNISAGTLASITLPDSVQAGETTLLLNGIGLRTKYMVKVYVAGLYLAQKSSDPDAILKADAPKRIVMQFVRGVSKNQIAEAFQVSFTDNTPDAKKAMQADIDRLVNALEPLKEGDQMIFTYLPGTGTTFALNGRDKLTVAGPAFGHMMFSVWLGPKPPNAGLKKGLLGQ